MILFFLVSLSLLACQISSFFLVKAQYACKHFDIIGSPVYSIELYKVSAKCDSTAYTQNAVFPDRSTILPFGSIPFVVIVVKTHTTHCQIVAQTQAHSGLNDMCNIVSELMLLCVRVCVFSSLARVCVQCDCIIAPVLNTARARDTLMSPHVRTLCAGVSRCPALMSNVKTLRSHSSGDNPINEASWCARCERSRANTSCLVL